MIRRTAIIVGALSAMLVAGGPHGADGASPGKVYSELEASQMLGAGSRSYLIGGAPFWTPKRATIQELESRLPAFIASHQPTDQEPIGTLSEYRIQYFGITRGGAHKIYLNAFCRSYWEHNSNWADHLVFVLDGGSCFFQLYYDTSKKRFEDLHVNGNA